MFFRLGEETPEMLFYKPLRQTSKNIAKDEGINDWTLVEWMHDLCVAGFL